MAGSLTVEDINEALLPFADPATDHTTTTTEHSARIQLVRDGTARDYVIDLRTGDIEARHQDGKIHAGLESLLASTEFADLRALAETQARVIMGDWRTSSEGKPIRFIEQEIVIDGVPSNLNRLRDYVKTTTGNYLSVFLLDGPAGIGKTSLIKRFSFERAHRFLRGGELPPLLHIQSKGHRLPSLPAVLAHSLQLIRAKFTFEQVPILVRKGLLQVAIDGFDELTDADGYKQAWYALKDYLDTVQSGGPCLLAGRDTFFDQEMFITQLGDLQYKVSVNTGHLSVVRPDVAKKWLLDNEWPKDEVESETTDEVFRDSSYALRPYFLSVLTGARGWHVISHPTFRGFLINEFLNRERALLERMVSIGPEAARSTLEQLFAEVAMDMVDREADYVDLEFLSFACEVVFSGTLNADNIRRLQNKMGSIGLLEVGHIRGTRVFPHSEIQHYFLAKGIVRSVLAGNAPRVLRRGLLGMDFLALYSEALEEFSSNDVSSFFKRLHNVISKEVSYDRLPYNGAALLLTSLGGGTGKLSRLSDLTANECLFQGLIAPAELTRVSIDRLDARGADLSKVKFRDCTVAILIADETTVFGSRRPMVHQVSLDPSARTAPITARAEIDAWLADHSTPRVSASAATTEAAPGNEYPPLMQLFDRVCRRAMRRFYLRNNERDPAGALLQNDLWPILAEILSREGRLEYRIVDAAGPADEFVHVKNSKALLKPSPEDHQSQKIRAQVAEKARELSP